MSASIKRTRSASRVSAYDPTSPDNWMRFADGTFGPATTVRPDTCPKRILARSHWIAGEGRFATCRCEEHIDVDS